MEKFDQTYHNVSSKSDQESKKNAKQVKFDLAYSDRELLNEISSSQTNSQTHAVNAQYQSTKSQTESQMHDIEKLQGIIDKSRLQTAALSKQLQHKTRVLTKLIPSLNILISSCEIAQKNGAFSLHVANQVFVSVQNIKSLLNNTQDE